MRRGDAQKMPPSVARNDAFGSVCAEFREKAADVSSVGTVLACVVGFDGCDGCGVWPSPCEALGQIDEGGKGRDLHGSRR